MGVFMRWLGPLIRLMHRPRMVGAENIPRQGPFLLVANHSGGMAVSEIFCLVVLYQRHLRDVPLAAMAHPFSFHLWPLTWGMRWTGAIPSSYDSALRVLGEGCGVLVFPGGDHEVSRPFWQADRVDFNGRKGFVRIAREAGVPIVPMGIQGSHWSVPILGRSTLLLPWGLVLPRIFGLKRYPVTLLGVLGIVLVLLLAPAHLGWPLSLGLAWLWMVSLLPLTPWVPVSITMRIGPPLPPEALFDGAPDELDRASAKVVERVQQLVRARD